MRRKPTLRRATHVIYIGVGETRRPALYRVAARELFREEANLLAAEARAAGIRAVVRCAMKSRRRAAHMPGWLVLVAENGGRRNV